MSQQFEHREYICILNALILLWYRKQYHNKRLLFSTCMSISCFILSILNYFPHLHDLLYQLVHSLYLDLSHLTFYYTSISNLSSRFIWNMVFSTHDVPEFLHLHCTKCWHLWRCMLCNEHKVETTGFHRWGRLQRYLISNPDTVIFCWLWRYSRLLL